MVELRRWTRGDSQSCVDGGREVSGDDPAAPLQLGTGREVLRLSTEAVERGGRRGAKEGEVGSVLVLAPLRAEVGRRLAAMEGAPLDGLPLARCPRVQDERGFIEGSDRLTIRP